MSMPRRHLDQDDAIRLYRVGLTYEEIARQLHATPHLVWRRLHEWGVIGTGDRHGGRWRRDVDAEAVVRAYGAGESEKAIAARLGVARSTIRARLMAARVVIRDRHAAESLKWQTLKRDRIHVVAQLGAAWRASRHRIVPLATLRRAAQTRARRLRHVGRYEEALRIALHARGVRMIPQHPVGRYNLDLAIRPTRVAVEVLTAYLGAAKSAAPERLHYLFDRGWRVLILWCPTREGTPEPDALAQHVLAFMEATRRTPPGSRQYGVIRGDGQPVTARCLDRYQGTRVMGF